MQVQLLTNAKDNAIDSIWKGFDFMKKKINFKLNFNHLSTLKIV